MWRAVSHSCCKRLHFLYKLCGGLGVWFLKFSFITEKYPADNCWSNFGAFLCLLPKNISQANVVIITEKSPQCLSLCVIFLVASVNRQSLNRIMELAGSGSFLTQGCLEMIVGSLWSEAELWSSQGCCSDFTTIKI